MGDDQQSSGSGQENRLRVLNGNLSPIRQMHAERPKRSGFVQLPHLFNGHNCKNSQPQRFRRTRDVLGNIMSEMDSSSMLSYRGSATTIRCPAGDTAKASPRRIAIRRPSRRRIANGLNGRARRSSLIRSIVMPQNFNGHACICKRARPERIPSAITASRTGSVSARPAGRTSCVRAYADRA
jgi:hypothetical protein